jgi:DNA-binding NarL/FixJ family response regulator
MGGGPPLRVLLAEDEPKLALAVQALCETQDHLEIAAIVTTAQAAVEHARTAAPDVVLLDVRLQGTDGIEAAVTIRNAQPDVGLVIYSGDETDLERARSLGFQYVLLKGAMTHELITAITSAHGAEGGGADTRR